MKVILFFVCMLVCGMSFAEPLAEITCTEGDVTHIYQGDSEDHSIVYIDGKQYTFVKEHIVGDISFTQFAGVDDPEERAYLQVDMYEGEDAEQYVKLVLMRHGDRQAQFGGLCKL